MLITLHWTILQLFTYWMVLGLLLTGIGLLVHRILLRRPLHPVDALYGFWIGFGLSIAGLQIWHFFAPVNALPFVPIGLMGLMGLLLEWRLLRNVFSHWRVWIIQLLLLLALCFYVANQIVLKDYLMHYAYDDGLYHIQSMRWNQTFSIVPGLGNLHGRFAFNDSSSLLWAMLDALPGLPPVRYIGTSLLLVMAGLHLMARSWSRRNTPQRTLNLLLIFPLTIIGVTSNGLISLKNDYTVFILGILIGVELLDLLLTQSDEHRSVLYRLGYITLLATAGITIKLSFLVFAGLAVIIALGVVMKQYPHLLIRASCIVSSIGLTLIGIWLLRGVILSGYPLYPQTTFAIPVEWQMPAHLAISEGRWVMSWARKPGLHPDVVLANWDWLADWWMSRATRIVQFTIPTLLIFISLTRMIFIILMRRKIPFWNHSLGAWLAPLMIGLAFWFFTAPDPRFVWHILWLMGLGLGMIAIGYEKLWQLARPIMLLLTIGMLIDYILLPRNGLNVQFSAYEPTILTTFTTDSGLVLNVPMTGDQCWDAPLPCTPYPAPEIRLRIPDELGSGFIR
jgi:hypothetical protein